MANGNKLSELELKAKLAIAGAKEEYGTSIGGCPIKWKIGSDEGGKFLEAFVEDSTAAGVLREKILTKFMGFRTIISCTNLVEDKSALRNFSYEDPGAC